MIKPTNYPYTGRTFGKYKSQEEIDLEYDVEKAVLNFPDYIDLYESDSVKIRAAIPVCETIQYGHTLMERLNVYPAKAPNAPVLLFVHGGYWKLGMGEDYDFVAAGPTLAGFTVVVISYGLAPNVSIVEMVRQVRASIAWTFKNISDFNGNPNRIILSGHSAGAHLAAMAISTEWQDYGLDENTVKGILAISGLYDLEPVSQTFVQPTVRITAEQILYSSPIRLIRPSTIPIVVSWGALETDAFREQSSNFIQAWLEAGNQGKEMIIPRAHHFNILEGFTEGGFLTKAVIELSEWNNK